ncbi:hypothetical protein N7509_001909 [Penicillium cosmopolitanum]|uniref:endo-polygalacturonase n=1 Tax=Penicillium cosmopolitanum TaxID=1131564 RepID=A0A9W9W7X4_9EURO|nr:uncharacterized protein N7509_001909 [Penicillium cosmopolitanum]KAJ5408026.1 hypothetical protein N7509_001909 [Penicillium cosmopolitanum]
MRTAIASVLALCAAASAAPSSMGKRAKWTKTTRSSSSSTSCTFNSAASASASASSCSTIVLDNIAVPAGETLDLEDLQDGAKLIFSGETTFGYKEWDGPLIRVSGSNIAVSGTSNHTINGGGERWWDSEGSNGGKTKPKFFYAHGLDDSTITGLNVKNTPIQAFSVQSDNIVLSNINIDNSDGDDNGGHNTDAFDVGESNGVTIRGATVKNQDDCLAINSGSNIIFTGGTCSGGHGLSIGSIGGRDNNSVKNVTISHSTVSNSQNGIRIKAKSGETGSVSGVTFSNIQLSGITDYGVVIQQDYDDEGNPTTGIPITDLTVQRVAGTVESDATPIYIMCGDGSCSDWTWSGVSVSGGESSDDCENVPSGASC